MPQCISHPERPVPEPLHAELRAVRYYNRRLLFPHSPIEVEVAEDRFHFFVEGAWDSWEKTQRGCTKRIQELLTVHALIWSTPRNFLHPEWPGWKQVDRACMHELIAGREIELN